MIDRVIVISIMDSHCIPESVPPKRVYDILMDYFNFPGPQPVVIPQGSGYSVASVQGLSFVSPSDVARCLLLENSLRKPQALSHPENHSRAPKFMMQKG